MIERSVRNADGLTPWLVIDSCSRGALSSTPMRMRALASRKSRASLGRGRTSLALMTLPDFQTMMRPVLACLVPNETRCLPEIRAAVADVLKLTDEEQKELLSSGKRAAFSNRVAWALFHMWHARLVERPARGRYQLTDRGQQVFLDHANRIDVMKEREEAPLLHHIKESFSSSIKGPMRAWIWPFDISGGGQCGDCYACGQRSAAVLFSGDPVACPQAVGGA